MIGEALEMNREASDALGKASDMSREASDEGKNGIFIVF